MRKLRDRIASESGDERGRQHRAVGRRERVRTRDAPVPVPTGVRRPGERARRATRRRLPADRRVHARGRDAVRQPRAALQGGDRGHEQRRSRPVLNKLVFEPRWTAVTKLDVDANVIGDLGSTQLVRDVRLLVPIDVQALVVGTDTTETMVRLPSALNDPSGKGVGFPAPFDGGYPAAAGRPPPLGHARTRCCRGGSPTGTDSNRLSLPALPDRWVVLRLLTPVGATQVAVRGLGARGRTGGAGRTGRLAGGERDGHDTGGRDDRRRRSSPAPRAAPPRGRRPTTRSRTGSRCTTRSTTSRRWRPTASTATARRTSSPVGGTRPTHDPLDAASNQGSLDALLQELGWSAVAPWVDAPGRSAVARRGHPAAVVGRARLGRTAS